MRETIYSSSSHKSGFLLRDILCHARFIRCSLFRLFACSRFTVSRQAEQYFALLLAGMKDFPHRAHFLRVSPVGPCSVPSSIGAGLLSSAHTRRFVSLSCGNTFSKNQSQTIPPSATVYLSLTTSQGGSSARS